MSITTRITFAPGVPMEEVEGTVRLAALAAESLHGPCRIELESPWHLDARNRAVVIHTGTETGQTLAIIFLGYARREFGGGAISIENLGLPTPEHYELAVAEAR